MHCARFHAKYCKHETRRLCFYIIMQQILDKCCNRKSVAKVYELKSQPSYMSRLMGKLTICIGENKDADQLRGNREADQRLCFRYSDSTIPLLLKSEISSFYLFSVLVQAGLCRTCSETTLLDFPRGGSNYVMNVFPCIACMHFGNGGHKAYYYYYNRFCLLRPDRFIYGSQGLGFFSGSHPI